MSNTNRQIKYLPIFYIGITILFGGLVILVNNNIKDPSNDLFNTTTLVIEVGVGIAITWTVYVYSKRLHSESEQQQKNTKKITEDIKKILDEQQAAKHRLQVEYARKILTLINLARMEIFGMKAQIKFLKILDSSSKKFVKTPEQLEEEESRRKQFESHLSRLKEMMTKSSVELETILEQFDESTMLKYDKMWKMFVFGDSLLSMGEKYYESLMEQFIKTGIESSEELHEILIENIPESQKKGYSLWSVEPS